MNSTNFRILPLLIVVAMLAFSVRVADMVLGASSISGSAQAEEKPVKDISGSSSIADQIAARKAGEAKLEKHAESEASMTEKEGGLHVEQVPDVELPDVKWRDASDQELDYASVRMEMFEDLASRRKMINKREKELMTREALLRAAEQEIDRKFQELSGLRREIEGLLERQSSEEQAGIASLVKIYEGMKPKDAARIFDTLDLDVLIAVMSEMSERKLSPILAAMNPERARTITIMLAEQKKLPELPYIE